MPSSQEPDQLPPSDFLPRLGKAPLPEPYYYLSGAQASVIQRSARLAASPLAAYVPHLPGWVPHRVVAIACGFGTEDVDGAVSRHGAYVWAPEFENVHSLWAVDEPPYTFRGVTFAGSEQLFQMQKVPEAEWTPELLKRFGASTPMEAYGLGRSVPTLRKDWDDARVEAMRVALRHKFGLGSSSSSDCRDTRRAALQELLRETAGHPLASVKGDRYWGTGGGGEAAGENMLARLLQELRDQQQQPSDDASLHVVLITDPGRDIDDTFAMLALHGHPDVALGKPDDESTGKPTVVVDLVVTSGGNANARADLTRRWLRTLLGPDRPLPRVIACPDVPGVGRAECAMPSCLPPAEDGHKGSADDVDASTAALLEHLETYQGRAFIVAIAPLTPLLVAADKQRERAVKALQRCGGLFAQGQVKLKTTAASSHRDEEEAAAATGVCDDVAADDAAFNFREDMASADFTLSNLVSGGRPIWCLGKHAAYAVAIRRTDLAELDQLAVQRFGQPLLQPMTAQIMDVFRHSNPELFGRLYPGVPLASSGDQQHPAPDATRKGHHWFDKIDVCSHPYDPLLVLWAVDVLAAKLHPRAEATSVFAPSITHLTGSGTVVYRVGASPEAVGLATADDARRALLLAMRQGLQGSETTQKPSP